MLRNNLRLKVSLYLILALSPAVVLLPYAIVRHQEEHLQDEISRHVTQIAELIVKSTRYAMLENERDIAGKIIQDIGRQAGIERVRVLNKDGTIIHSKRASEIGTSLSQKDEPCVRCHQGTQPLRKVADQDRWRIYADADGRRVLTAMEPIRNEPTCANASCHEHPASQSVLGVVDIAYSLNEVDTTLRQHGHVILAISALTIVAVAVVVAWLLRRLIYVPLGDLNAAAKRISAGNLDQPVPVRSEDEFGRVAASVNQMSDALKASMRELHELVQTLELKVAERTKELRHAEAEIAQSEKLAAIGQLAAGIAHELNNPLTGVLTFTSLLRKKLPEGSADAEDLDLVIRETKRCAAIIRRLLDFAREKVPTKGFIALNPLVAEVVRLLDRPATLQDIEIRTELDPDLPQIWGDADLIKQVVLNIVVNATQAIADHGQVVVRTRRLGAPTDKPAAPEMVEIAVSDNGCGIPEANLQRIFDPFFTTKEVGKGTGLGLSVSYGIVKAHGGAIKVETKVGEGSTFRIQLPTADASADAEPTTADATP
jgi:two-component system NtrC family sensor kinase